MDAEVEEILEFIIVIINVITTGYIIYIDGYKSSQGSASIAKYAPSGHTTS